MDVRNRKILLLLLLLLPLFSLSAVAAAVEIPEALEKILPAELLEVSHDHSQLLERSAQTLWDSVREKLSELLRAGIYSAVRLTLAVLLCSAGMGAGKSIGSGAEQYAPFVGALVITALSAGDLHTLIGQGAETIEQLSALSAMLLPTVAGAIAAGGYAGTAGAWQAATLIFSDFLMSLVRNLLLPLIYLYIGTVSAAAMLKENSVRGIAAGIKKCIVWGLSGIVIVFTTFLSLSNMLTGASDRMAVKVTRLAISNAVPVVGGILSDATESIFAGASLLRGTVGVLGVVAVLTVCLLPLLRLGIQYLFYKAAAFLSSIAGESGLNRLVEDIGGAFGVVLGMTGACALLLIVALFLSVTMVVI